MDIAFDVLLPVDARSVPLIRGPLRQAREHRGVVPAGIEEVLLALSEAGANVVRHGVILEKQLVTSPRLRLLPT